MPIEIRVKIQRHLALANLADDDGRFAFVLCRRGFEQLIGRRTKIGDEIQVEVTAKMVERDS